MKRAFSRRWVLRGLGGAAVAAPFLASVAEREAKTQGLPAPPPPKRLIVYYTYAGCLTNRWFPALSHGRLTRDDYAAMRTLSPMAPYADKLLMVRGIRAMNEWSFEGTLGQKNDPYTQVCGSYFTCHPVTPNSTESSASNPGKFDAKPTGRSLDHICAEQVNASGAPPLFIQIGGIQGSTSNNMSVISWDQPEQIFPGIGSPATLFGSLTNLFGSGPVSPDTYQAVRRKTVLDCVRDDLDRLRSAKMSRADQVKLSAWADLLHETSTTVINSQCTADAAARLGLTDASVQPVTGSNLSKTAPLMMDLAVLSAMCDANRVIFMKMPFSANLSFLGVPADATSLSHRIGNAGMGGQCLTDAIELIQKVDSWYAQQFAYLVGRLDGITEGDRTLLDSSATIWFQQMSDGNAANLNNLPILQAGSCGDYFKTGWAINVENANPNMTPGHSDEDCKNGQTPYANLEMWGTPPNVATQPINKYYCNLMNAMGVKAGADGFAAKGGTEPVTRFGKYDDTTLFPTNEPAVIKNPGEYAELRAS
jgi:Protein of unknown function (DUF1552)